MKNILNSEYFFYGSAVYNEAKNHYIQYALYEPISDRFVLTSKSEEVLKLLAILFSSRLKLFVCELHYASNFNPNLIDNSCCLNWTIKDKEKFIISASVNEFVDTSIYTVKKLVEANNINSFELILSNQEYLLASVHWVSDSEKGDIFHNHIPFFQNELQLNSYVNLPLKLSSSSEKMKKIFDIIYSEFNFDVAKEKIKSL